MEALTVGCSGGSCSTCSSCSENDGRDDRDLPPGMLDRYDLDQSVADGALVWLEVLHCPDGIRMTDASLKLLDMVCGANPGRTFAVIFGGPDLKPLYPSIFGFGVGSIYHVRDKGSECYDSNVYSATICDIIDRVSPALVALPSSDRGNQLGEKISAMLGVTLRRDCEIISMDGRIVNTVPAAMDQFLIENRKRFPQTVTLRTDSQTLPEIKEGQGTAIYWQTWKM